MERRPERISSLNVERGLYVLRYVTASAADHPVIFVRPSPGDEEMGLQLIPVPGEPADRLKDPGAFMVVVVPEAVSLQLTARAMSARGSLNADLRLEPMRPLIEAAGDTGVAPVVMRPERKPAAAPAAPAAPRTMAAPAMAWAGEGLRLRAHLAHRGDVEGEESGWVAGPGAPTPVEGIAVDCPSALGEVQAQVLIAGQSRWSGWMTNGAFGGSKGRATPLVGVRFRFLPAAGVEAKMEGEALFLGSAILRKEGSEMEFRSAAGADPLLGVRLAMRREQPVSDREPAVVSTAPQSGRVRVFRASGRR